MADIQVCVLGLDTSHSIEFSRRIQAPDCPPDQKVPGMRVVSCLRFSTRYHSEEGMDQRQKQLEAWGIPVTRDFDEAVKKADAILMEINDPACHLEYFKHCAGLGKPLFLDKPLADTIENGRAIADTARQKKTRVFSASSLRFVPQLGEACAAIPKPALASVYGPLGKAPAGSSIVWYGVHAFEMLQRAMGRGAVSVMSRKDKLGVVALVEYTDDRRGVVELTEGSYLYGGCLRTMDKAVPYVVDMSRAYSDELIEVARFFAGADPPVAIEDTLEVMGLLDAAERSSQSGATERV